MSTFLAIYFVTGFLLWLCAVLADSQRPRALLVASFIMSMLTWPFAVAQAVIATMRRK
jgi:Mn2+/Fe2+ NRAMP family transporter